jgi:recA bacterial DNA recombination protein
MPHPLSERSESKGTATSRESLESLLRHRKLDHTFWGLTPVLVRGSDPMTAPGSDPARWHVPTGMPELDTRLDGGIPRGHLSEVVGPRSAGRLAILVSALAGATSRGEAVVLIDPLDMFDPVSVSASGIDFQRMLWIRGEATSSARVSLSCEYGTLQKSLDRAVKALNIVLQAGPHARQPRVGPEAGGFGLVVLDLGEVAAQTIKRLPYTTWLRLHRVIEGSETACVLIASEPIARSAGGVTIQLALGSGLSASGLNARVIRARKIESDHHVRVPLSAAAC